MTWTASNVSLGRRSASSTRSCRLALARPRKAMYISPMPSAAVHASVDELLCRILEGDRLSEVLASGLMAGEPVLMAALLRQIEAELGRAERWN
jgi:hypothetical protein